MMGPGQDDPIEVDDEELEEELEDVLEGSAERIDDGHVFF